MHSLGLECAIFQAGLHKTSTLSHKPRFQPYRSALTAWVRERAAEWYHVTVSLDTDSRYLLEAVKEMNQYSRQTPPETPEQNARTPASEIRSCGLLSPAELNQSWKILEHTSG